VRFEMQRCLILIFAWASLCSQFVDAYASPKRVDLAGNEDAYWLHTPSMQLPTDQAGSLVGVTGIPGANVMQIATDDFWNSNGSLGLGTLVNASTTGAADVYVGFGGPLDAAARWQGLKASCKNLENPPLGGCRANDYYYSGTISIADDVRRILRNTYTYNDSQYGGEDCSFYANNDPSNFYSFVEVVLFHEIGHMLGLHDYVGSEESTALMYYDLAHCKDQQLVQASKDRLFDLYGGSNTQVTLTSPEEGAVYQVGDNIQFDASALQLSSGSDVSSQIVWNSSIDGDFATGATVTTNFLRPGEHFITASVNGATKSLGPVQEEKFARGRGGIDHRRGPNWPIGRVTYQVCQESNCRPGQLPFYLDMERHG